MCEDISNACNRPTGHVASIPVLWGLASFPVRRVGSAARLFISGVAVPWEDGFPPQDSGKKFTVGLGAVVEPLLNQESLKAGMQKNGKNISVS